MVLGMMGPADTFYYHEWKLRLPETPTARRELRLHASRHFAYDIVFGSLRVDHVGRHAGVAVCLRAAIRDRSHPQRLHRGR